MENESLTSPHRSRAIRDALRDLPSFEKLDRVVLWQLYGVVKKIQKDLDVKACLSACGNRPQLRRLASKTFGHNGINLLVDILSESSEPDAAFMEFLREEVRRGVDTAVRDVVSSGEGTTLSNLSRTTEELILRIDGELKKLGRKVLAAPGQPARRPPKLGKRSTDKLLQQSLLGARS